MRYCSCEDGRLDRRGVKGMRETDRVLGHEPVRIAALLPQQHVRDVTVGLRALHQAAQLLLRELRIDVEQRDRVEGAVPEPLEGVMRRRWAHEVELLSVPLRDPTAPVPREDAACFGGDAASLFRVGALRSADGRSYLIEPAKRPCTK